MLKYHTNFFGPVFYCHKNSMLRFFSSGQGMSHSLSSSACLNTHKTELFISIRTTTGVNARHNRNKQVTFTGKYYRI